jgi:hypothetical protein
MFIETGYEHDPRSSGAHVSGNCMEVHFAPLERGDPLELARSINVSSLRNEEIARKSC